MQKKYTVSLSYTKLPAPMLAGFMGWIGTCMKGNAAFPNPPIPLVPPVPADPTAPVDLLTRQTALQAAIVAAAGGGTALTAAKNDAMEVAISGLDALAFYVQTIVRYDLTMLLSSGFQAASSNRAQSPLDAPTILGIDTDISTQLTLHLTPITNANGYEVQFNTAGSDWKTITFSTQARSIVLTGLTSGTPYNVRVRALGGSDGYSPWSIPSSRYVT
jgi:hypothetical protein